MMTPEATAAVAAETTPSPRYRTRSHIRSHSDSGTACSPEGGLKFPFFDDHNNNTSLSQNYDMFMSPGNPKSTQQLATGMDSSGWETDLSPIARNRGSDASQEVLDVPVIKDCNSPAPKSSPDANTHSDEGVSDGGVRVVEANQLLSPKCPSEDEEADIRDLSSARKQVGQSSHEFIERIRNAAHRRKVAMTKSRDSLAAKEEEQLRSIAERINQAASDSSSTSQEQAARRAEPSSKHRDSVNDDSVKKRFKARPLPPTTGALGSGGLDGVPKVEKRPTTTPFSPLLGQRRPQKTKIKALEEPKQSFKPVKSIPTSQPVILRPTPPIIEKKENELVRPFKARAVPTAVRSEGGSGQYGVPKVEKRPLTVAMSPQLGPRRRSRSADARQLSDVLVPKVLLNATQPARAPRIPDSSRMTRARTRSMETMSTSSVVSKPLPKLSESPVLLGLKLLTTPRNENPIENDENLTPTSNSSAKIRPFEPYSTRRAKKRAEFDTRRKTMFELRTEREIKEREKDIRKMQRELHVLRQEL